MGSAAQHCARLRPALERHGSIDRGSTSGSSALSSGTRSAVFLFRPRNPAVARGRQGATSIDPLRCWTYYCLFGLLAVTGLRLGEALNLRTEDLDWSEGMLTIRGAKFGKSRLVPLHASTCKVLADYAKRRDHVFRGRKEGPFLVNKNGNRLDKGEVHCTFYALSRQIGLRAVDASRGPRLHDFRHRFAVQTLLHWYRTGDDPERRLPILSTYLGHAHVTDTYWYLTGTPELLGQPASAWKRGGRV